MQIVNSEQIRKCMQETGMDYIQARNHLVARFWLTQRVEREHHFPQMGKSCYDNNKTVDSAAALR